MENPMLIEFGVNNLLCVLVIAKIVVAILVVAWILNGGKVWWQ
jgi:hypothetical protein